MILLQIQYEFFFAIDQYTLTSKILSLSWYLLVQVLLKLTAKFSF